MSSFPRKCTAFANDRRVASGFPSEVAIQVKRELESDTGLTVLVFDDDTGQPIDFNLRGSDAEVLARLADPAGEEPMPRSRGRPKLGVVAREVTLLPRHWDWLSSQPGGASVALRKLVEAARGANRATDDVRRAQEATGRIMTALGGDLAGYEEATRALYSRDAHRFATLIQAWPTDVRIRVMELASAAFGDTSGGI